MKIFRLFALAAFAMLLGFSFSSCDKENDVDASNLEGTWYVTREVGYEKNASKPESNKSWDNVVAGRDQYIILTEKKTFEMVDNSGDGEDFNLSGTWTLSGDKLILTSSDVTNEAKVIKLTKDKFEFSFHFQRTVEGVKHEFFQHYYLVK